MTAVPPPAQQQQQQTTQVGAPATGTGAPAAAPPPQPTVQTPAQGLPPTGIDQQLATINQTNQVANAVAQPAVAAGQPANMQMAGAPAPAAPSVPSGAGGSTDIQQLARSLAQQYGLPIGRGDIVDAQGNFLMTPDQIAPQTGSGSAAMGNVAAKMNFISSAIANEQNRQQQQKGIAAIQTGLGQVQSRGRGSLAGMQSGMYQDLADLYSNQEYEAADFSYFIQQSMFNQAAHQAHRARKGARSTARYQLIGSVAGGAAGLLL